MTEAQRAKLIAFFTKTYPKANGVYKNKSDQWLDDNVEKRQERGERMADRADHRADFQQYAYTDLVDTAAEYLFGDE